MTIYFVDEDAHKFGAWLKDLELRRYKVTTVTDADRAFDLLIRATDVEWVIIDVMLSATEQPATKYPRERTDDSLETGLVLLQDLVDQRGEIFPRRASLLTNTTKDATYRAAAACAERHGITLIDKLLIGSARDFGRLISGFVAAANDEASDG